MSSHDHSHGAAVQERSFPPIDVISVVIMGLVIIGGIYMASHLPKPVSLKPVVAIVVIAALLLVYNIFTLSRLKDFAWGTFFLVAKWSLLAYAIIAGTIEFIFIFDKTKGAPLAIFSAILLIFAVNIPVHFGFSVARYQEK